MTFNDVPWCFSLAYKRYRSWDPGAVLPILLDAIRNPQSLALRTEHAFLIAVIIPVGWRPTERECIILAICADEGCHWEAVMLLRRSVAWAKEMKCCRWWVQSEEAHHIDMMAKRIGARAGPIRYFVEIEP